MPCAYRTIAACARPADLVAVWRLPGDAGERRTPVCRRHLYYVHNTAHVLREEPVPSEREEKVS